jgi:hypothetical protein
MGINLSGSDVRMTKQELNHAQIGTMVQQVCGERMTQGMW